MRRQNFANTLKPHCAHYLTLRLSEEHNLDRGGLPPEFCRQFNCDLIFRDIIPLARNIGIVYFIVHFLNPLLRTGVSNGMAGGADLMY